MAGGRGRWIVAGVAAVAVVVAGGLVVRAQLGHGPPAMGRPSDRCRATGGAGLVGLDQRTGRVRWSNVVGESVSRMWAGSAPVDGKAHLVVVGEDGSARTVVARTGAVDRCPVPSKPRPEDLPVPATVDASGATAVDRVAGAVDVVEADGSRRWRADGRHLVGSSSGGVVVQSDIDQTAIEDDCCNGRAPALSIEVLVPASGTIRWSKEVPGVEAVVTPTHLVVLDQFDVATDLPGPTDPGSPPTMGRITAYSLADGREAWHARLPGVLTEVYASEGTVYVPAGRDRHALIAIDEVTGARRWQAPLPEPGRGGDATLYGGTSGLAVNDGVVAVVVQSVPPHRG